MIETERLLLRPNRLEDLEARHAMTADAEVVRFIGNGMPQSREDAWNRLLRNAGHWSLFGYGMFAIFEQDSGKFLGETGLGHFQRGLGEGFDPFPEAAWVMTRAAQGRGIAVEAAAAVHSWFEARHGQGRTVCIIHPGNERSIRLANSLGYSVFGEASFHDSPVLKLERTGGGGAGLS